MATSLETQLSTALDLAGIRHHPAAAEAGLETLDLRTRARTLMRRLAMRSPERLQRSQLANIERISFHVEQAFVPGGAVADLGGGLGLFTPVCAALGMDAFLVDDFGDSINATHPIEEMPAHRETGVQVVKTDANHWGEYFEDESLDVVTSFDSIEHWHHSPRHALQEACRALRPGGVLLLGLPNAANLRKRVSVVLGRSNWSAFEDWYYPERFRGHVREPVLADILRMIEDLGLERRQVWGRNWAGYMTGGLRSRITRLIDLPLRLRPTLCSDLYVAAVKPA